MNDEQALMALSKNKKQGGAGLVALSFLLSLCALGLAGFAVWAVMFQAPPERIIAPLVQEDVRVKALEEKVTAQQSLLTALGDDLKTAKTALEGLSKNMNEASSKSASAFDTESYGKIQQKIIEMEAKASVGTSELQGEIARKIKTLLSLTVLDHVALRLQRGQAFGEEVKDVEASLPATQAVQDAFNTLKDSAGTILASDTLLRETLRRLTPDFLAKEKMARADNAFDKILIQLQKLVVIRPKDGSLAAKDTPVAKTLTALDEALRASQWTDALRLAERLNDKAPKDYTGFLESMRKRAKAEEALVALRKTLLADIRSDKNAESLAP